MYKSVFTKISFIIILIMSGCVAETSVFENPYEGVNWGLQYGGQGAHMHTSSYGSDAKERIEDIVPRFTNPVWGYMGAPPLKKSGGWPTTAWDGYDFFISADHTNYISKKNWNDFNSEWEEVSKKYGVVHLEGAEIVAPREGTEYDEFDDYQHESCFGIHLPYIKSHAYTAVEIVRQCLQYENDTNPIIAVIDHPNCGDGDINEFGAISMTDAGAEYIEIYNANTDARGKKDEYGKWVYYPKYRINDHQGRPRVIKKFNITIDNPRGNITGKYRPDANAEDKWDFILSTKNSKGTYRRIWGLADDDYHGNHGNYAWQVVLLKSPAKYNKMGIMRAFERGATYASQGVKITEIKVKKDTIYIESDIAELIEWIGTNGTILKTTVGPSGSYKLNPTDQNDDIYVRAKVISSNENNSFFFNEHTIGDGPGNLTGDAYAWTQPFFVKREST